MQLLNHLLPLPRRQLLILLGQVGTGREDGRAVGHLVRDVHDLAVGFAVFLQQGGDGLARFGGVGDLELAFGVLVLRVDDDEGGVGGRGGRAGEADDLAEGLRGHGFKVVGMMFGVEEMRGGKK